MLKKPVLWALIAILLIINVTYWQDPWLWRNYVHFFSSGELTGVERLQPDEEIRGDGSYVLPVAGAGQRTISSAALAAMHDYAQEFGTHALITVHRGMIQDEWYADHWQRDWMTQSQSMHKSLMGLFIGMAIEDGRISSVDAPIGTWITEWADDPRGRITLRNLMQMSSGLGQYGFTLNPFDDGMKWLNSGRSIEAILRTPLADWSPGTKWDYNNINSELLGIILVRIYGQRYSVLLRDRLWLPMGGERAQIHTDSPGGRAFTSCCLAAPAMDWVRVGMLLLGRGAVNGKRIISAEWLQQMITPSSVAGYYGYQTWLGYDDPAIPVDDSAGSTGAIASEPFLARDTFMTWGRGQQHVFVVPSRELVIVRLGPALGRLPIKRGFDVTYFVNTAIRGLKQPDAMP
ncbi:MAG: serine hydrolase [Gammaproteobacteria bacterium]|jgi:CubicO group peptidase (beta-lactamase class C family)|nr:serine hydrolase [Gammaproteobacteria bacterium]MDP7154605.1 serine hydrolase [Gammaproteobacteria bacterium]MDP7296908.1 serine hydrolase [Gammaproteobacteria bacterium]MDP7420139.1 serine hydrolase [Gammaproteobacteria bacterium]MDP7661534.1 serine hydrolase [Gammaproteobacteria bacterium]